MRRSSSPDSAESEDKLLSDEESNWPQQSQQRRSFGWRTIALLAATAGISCFAGMAIGQHSRQKPEQDLNEACTPHVSNHSPILSDLNLEYHQQQYNGSFMKETIYRQDASPEVDAAWKALGGDYRPIRVTVEEAEKSGFSPNHVQIKEKYGGGYPANVEGMHHLHCLNLLRQTLYYNYDYYHALGEGAFKNDDYILRRHVSHCLDILRQQLMCTADVGVFGQVWVHKDHPEPFVDFNTEHKCRNFDEIRQWAEDHQLPEDTPEDFLQPPKSPEVVFADIP